MIKNVTKQRPKRSKIWKIPYEELKCTTDMATSLGQILRSFGLSDKGGNSKTLKKSPIK